MSNPVPPCAASYGYPPVLTPSFGLPYQTAQFGCGRCGIICKDYSTALEHHLKSPNHVGDKDGLTALYGIMGHIAVTKQHVDVFLLPPPHVATRVRDQAITDFDRKQMTHFRMPGIAFHGAATTHTPNSRKRRAAEIEEVDGDNGEVSAAEDTDTEPEDDYGDDGTEDMISFRVELVKLPHFARRQPATQAEVLRINVPRRIKSIGALRRIVYKAYCTTADHPVEISRMAVQMWALDVLSLVRPVQQILVEDDDDLRAVIGQSSGAMSWKMMIG